MILKKQDSQTGFIFEWHPEKRAVYKVSGVMGEQIASGITSPEAVDLVCNTWCRGYRYRDREIGRNPKVKHHSLFAEGGVVGSYP